MRIEHSPSSEPHCTCGWPRPEDRIPNRGHCCVCHESVMNDNLVDHLRVMHPERYGSGPEKWPDGQVVVEEAEITPEGITGDPS